MGSMTVAIYLIGCPFLNRITQQFFQTGLMKHNIFKIRKLGDPFQARQLTQFQRSARKATEIDDLKTTVQQTNEKMIELMGLFETFMKTSIQQSNIGYKAHKQQTKADIEVRDRYVHLPLPQSVTASKEEQEKWMTDVCIATFSTSFHYYLTEQMTFEQIKVFCSENILRNMLQFTQRFKLTDKDIENLNDHIGGKVLQYLQKKYPLTQSNDVNKALERQVQETNNLDLLTNDFLYGAGIMFKYSADGNYNDLIMRVINKAIEVAEQTSMMSGYPNENGGKQKKEMTNFSDFRNFMEGLFESVYDEEWMNGSKTQRADTQASYIANKVKADPQKEKYQEKVKSYTNYLIGRKISENAVPYTEEQIKSKNLIIKSPAILRILTKWCEELWEKFEKETYFTERTESIQLQDPEMINPIFKWMKQTLDLITQEEKKKIVSFKQEIDRNSYSQQSQFLLKHLEDDGITSIPKYEKASGKFATHTVKNLHSYITLYLNRLIHGLLTVSKRFKFQHIENNWDDWQSPPNLMTFKIGDLLRCKMSSKEKEIVKIFKELKQISERNPNKMKIVRIKNRLKQGTNDILINIKFNNIFICQIQLEVINKSKSKFIQCSNSFSHYIYEMKRSIFGPVSELCNIWNNFEARASEYEALINITKKQQDMQEHKCKQPNQKHQFIKFDLPFQCNFCSHLYYHNNYILPNKKCNTCNKYQCVKCQISQMEQQKLKKIIFSSKHSNLAQNLNKLKERKIPEVGVCVKIQSNIVNIEIFKFSKYEGKTWLLGKRDGQIYSIKRIKSSKDTQDFLEKYCIFQITQKQQQFIEITKKMTRKFSAEEYLKEVYKQEKEVVILTQLGFTVPEMVQLTKVDGGNDRGKKKIKRLQFASNDINDISYFSCFQNLTSINLDSNNFVNMKDICCFKSLQKLEMRDNEELATFNDQVCALTKLQDLKISNCIIDKLPQNFGNLALLTSIKMDKNKLNTLPDSICNIVNLKEINFERNKLISLPEEIGKLVNLKKMLLKYNNLTSLPQSFGQLCSLQIFDASINKLVSLPQNMSKINKLQTFRISSNEVSAVSASLFTSKSLKQLCLRFNKIEKLPEEVGTCINLQLLDLDHNLIQIIPDSLGQCTRLTRLTLSCNRIQNIPNSFIKHTQLPLQINLSDNCISQFPSYILTKMDFTHINLQYNQITQIPDQLANLQSLRVLQLAHNKIKILPECLTRLKVLYIFTITHNEITHVPAYINNIIPINQSFSKWGRKLVNNKISTFQTSEVFGSMENSIELKFNEITEIPMQLIPNKERIVSINFSNNKIKFIPKDIGLFTTLSQLYLDYNLIEVVPKEMEALFALQILDLSGNPIRVVECPQFFLQRGNQETKMLLPQDTEDQLSKKL